MSMNRVAGAARSWASLLGMCLVLCTVSPGLAQRAEPVQDLTPAERQKLVTEARQCDQRSHRFYGETKLVEALKECQNLLAINQRLYPPTEYPEGHADLAGSLNNLGFVLQEMGRLEPALDCHEQALAMMRRL